jgi:tetratricopeptide (TPR) repeat protein
MQNTTGEVYKDGGAQLHQEFLDAVNPVLRTAFENCSVHRQREADALCAQCEHLYCWECLFFDPLEERLVCPSCRTDPVNNRGPSWLARGLRMPFVYVLALVLITLAAYASGLGKPGPEAMRKADAGKPWHRQRAAKQWLQQAARAKERSKHLKKMGASQEETSRWAGLARTALTQARTCWKGMKPEIDIAIGEALALVEQGQEEYALQALQAIEGIISDQHPAYLPYLYHRGSVALKCSRQESAIDDWTQALKRIGAIYDVPSPEYALKEISKLLAGSLGENALHAQIRNLCDTSLNRYEIRDRILGDVQKNKLEEYFPKELVPRSKGTEKG